MLKNLKPPYLGVAYYPEDWPESEIDFDIRRMKELGLNVVRIAEFAWHRMEPRPGEFDFSFFHRVVDRMGEAGIGVVLGTPTATPPRWLSRLYPDVMMENANGRQASHGGRRHCCSNNAHYNEYSMRIVERMAQEFADDPSVIGWQIDNEIYSWNQGCFCPDCQGGFREYLRDKFGAIDALNDAWNLNLFSQWYDDFSDIPAPRDAWHNPHLRMEWELFQQNSHVKFVHRQAEILHKYVKVPVGTDTMPFNGMDYRSLNAKLDIVQFNHYNTPDNLHGECFWFDYLRTLKEHPFWNTETATCWNGSAEISQSIKPDGFCRANSWLPVALGGEANMYWLWRTHWAGHELTHGAVIDSSGRDMIAASEVQETAQGYRRAEEFISGTKVQPDFAIHFSSLGWNMHSCQRVVAGWEYMPTLQDSWYRPATELGLRPEVIDAAQPLDGYKLIFTPMLMTLEEHDLGARMAQWVENGGIWVVGPLSDVRDINGARYRDRYYGMLEQLTGVKWEYGVPDLEGRIQAEWTDGTPFEGRTWFEVCAPSGGMMARITQGHRSISGHAVLSGFSVGKGKVIVLGTVPSGKDMKRLIREVCAEAQIMLPDAEGEVMIAPRKGDAGEGFILVEYGAKAAALTLPGGMTDLITGRRLTGRIQLQPYEVLVLKSE